jgi:hypothetical protein
MLFKITVIMIESKTLRALDLKKCFTFLFPLVFLIIFNISPVFGQTVPPQEIAAASEKYESRFVELEKWLATPAARQLDSAERETELKKIDEPMLYPDALKLKCIADFFNDRMNVLWADYSKTKIENDGLIVWKLYNHSSIIQTKDIKIAVDLYSGYEAVKMDPELMKKFVDSVDILLVTHSHGDHTNPETLEMFVKAGKRVVVPKIFWPGYSFNRKLTVMREGEIKLNGATVQVFPGFQKEEPDNIYLTTTSGGLKVMNLGDENETFQAGDEWYKKIKKPVDIDIMIPNIWCPNLVSILKIFRPKLVISSHEHEIGHPVSGRRPYDYVYKVLRTIKTPFAVPMWGEKVVYNKRD